MYIRYAEQYICRYNRHLATSITGTPPSASKNAGDMTAVHQLTDLTFQYFLFEFPSTMSLRTMPLYTIIIIKHAQKQTNTEGGQSGTYLRLMRASSGHCDLAEIFIFVSFHLYMS